MKIILLFLLIFLSGCTKQKTVLICGDHKCVNKAEAKQYFEENLTLEVQILTKDKKKSYDLVDLNISGEKPIINIVENKNKKVVKKLSKKEKKVKKNEIKDKKILKLKKDKENKKKIIRKEKSSKSISSMKYSDHSIDICLKLEKCDIDSITKYLIKVSNEKKYPNISLKE
mgnify:CR=1 FL=1